MSFVTVAVGIVGEGIAANILAGAMMGGSVKVGTNVISGQKPFKDIGQGIVMGGLTGGLTPTVASTFNLSMPMAAGITQGGLTALATGDITKGLMAGATAYGMYGLTGVGEEMALNQTMSGADVAGVEQVFGDSQTQIGDGSAGAKFNEYLTKPNLTGAAAKANLTGNFLKDNYKYMAALAGPIMADQAVKSNMPQTVTQPGMIRPYSYNPYSGGFTAGNPYEITPNKAAGGGLMGMDDGGYSPGQLDFTQRSEPVVRMASGGMPRFAGADGSLTNSNAYEDRDDFSTGANNNLLNQQVKAPDPLADLYQSVLGRAPESQDVRDYWGNQFKGGATPGIDPDEITTFQGAARGELLANLNATRSADNQLVNDPNSVTGLTRPAEALTPAEGIAAIAAKQASDAKIANTNLAALQPANTTATTTTGGGLATLANATGTGTTTTTGGGLATLANATGATTTGATTTGRPTAEQAAATIATIYRNVLGRDPDPNGMAYWTQQLTSGAIDSATMYTDILKGAQANKETGNFGLSFADAQKGYTGYSSADASNIADEWVRNVLGREVTDADRKTQWYKDAVNKEVMNTYAKAENIYNNFRDYAALQTGSPAANLDLYQASKLMGPQAKVTTVTGGGGNDIVVPSGYHLENGVIVKNVDATQHTSTVVDKPTSISTTLATSLPVGVSGNTGPSQIGGGATVNPNGTITTSPVIPGIPVGGFTGMTGVRDAYTTGGGKLGYTSPTYTAAEFKTKYEDKLTGGSKQAYDYLSGKTPYSPTPYTTTGEVMKPYAESVLGIKLPSASKAFLFDPATRTYKVNPDYAIPTVDSTGKKSYATTNKDVTDYLATNPAGSDFATWMTSRNLSLDQVAAATGIPISTLTKKYAGNITTATAAAGNPIPFADLYQSVLNRPGDDTGLAYWRSRFGDTVDADELAIFKAAARASGELKDASATTATTATTTTTGNSIPFADLYQSVLKRDGDATGLAYWKSRFGDTVDDDELAIFKAAARSSGELKAANGGLMAMANGGMSNYDLGGYSDGGRLLRGPGDGVSDSIPATIGNKRPARLADGEFVVPARIVSELGNGSTEAGARKLYAMMDRVQAARRGSIGKGKVAKNSRADKYLPA